MLEDKKAEVPSNRLYNLLKSNELQVGFDTLVTS